MTPTTQQVAEAKTVLAAHQQATREEALKQARQRHREATIAAAKTELGTRRCWEAWSRVQAAARAIARLAGDAMPSSD